jgi:uncharacterized protein (DUF1810 family)
MTNSKAFFAYQMADSNTLNRFLKAQQTDYSIALSEIKSGKKQSHWMWYIFPQIQGLGFTETSKFYAIKDLNEAKEFLNDPVLGKRLIDICNELLKLETNDARRVFGTPDDIKLRSSMTLFSSVRDADTVFQKVLDKFFDGKKDQKTLQIIETEK